ncbi:ABC transporter substrate-binding protein [Streptomyces sp. NPDC048254]|uniref:ABC transporter substrate-binding protein n=1 Tax=Streptomyces sp. NPDC048254 TaxID=3365525 RepID=UPI00371FA235
MLATGAAAAAGSGLLTACGGSSSGSGTDDGTLTMASFPNGNTLDPWGSIVSFWSEQAVFDTLTRVKDDGTVGPWLATSWEYTDPSTLVMKLREDVKFSDGTAFDATAVKANFDYAKNSSGTKNSGSSAYVANIASVTVSDSHTVRFKLVHANPDMPWAFSQQTGWMASPTSLAKPKSMVMGAVGTGPYLLDTAASTAQQTYTYTRNPAYWAGKEGLFEKLVIKIISDQTAAVNAARTGQVDFLITPDPKTKISGFTSMGGAPLAIQGFLFQDLKGSLSAPLKDVRVRQAMNYALDRAAILKNVSGGQGQVNHSTPFLTSGPYTDSQVKTLYDYDPARAKELLAAAGYAKGFTVKALANAQFSTMAQAIAGYLRKVGVTLQLSEHSTDVIQETNSGKWPVVWQLTTVSGQPFSDVSNLMTESALANTEKNSDPKIDRLLRLAAEASGTAERKRIYQELSLYAGERAWLLMPVTTRNVFQWNAKKVTVSLPTGAATPDLFMMKPAG